MLPMYVGAIYCCRFIETLVNSYNSKNLLLPHFRNYKTVIVTRAQVVPRGAKHI